MNAKYVDGFGEACEQRGLDPIEVIKAAQFLDKANEKAALDFGDVQDYGGNVYSKVRELLHQYLGVPAIKPTFGEQAGSVAVNVLKRLLNGVGGAAAGAVGGGGAGAVGGYYLGQGVGNVAGDTTGAAGGVGGAALGGVGGAVGGAAVGGLHGLFKNPNKEASEKEEDKDKPKDDEEQQ